MRINDLLATIAIAVLVSASVVSVMRPLAFREGQSTFQENVLSSVDASKAAFSTVQHNEVQQSPKPRKVFIDLGANCGNSYLKLLKKGVVTPDWEVFLWEANPQVSP